MERWCGLAEAAVTAVTSPCCAGFCDDACCDSAGGSGGAVRRRPAWSQTGSFPHQSPPGRTPPPLFGPISPASVSPATASPPPLRSSFGPPRFLLRVHLLSEVALVVGGCG